MDELGLEDQQTWNIDIAKLGETLLDFTPATLERFIVTILARHWTLTGEGKDMKTMGKAIGLETVNIWEADDAFWNGITSKATLIKIAKDNKININEKDTAKKIRARLKDKMPTSWRPEWLRF
jgi:hypothetical protein